jgi:hypothetical protein
MTMSATMSRRRSRDSEADVETEIYTRPQNMPWDRVMVLQIMNELETRLPRVVVPPRRSSSRVVVKKRSVARITPVPPPDEPNVFLVPWTPADPPLPWATKPAAARAATTATATAATPANVVFEDTLLLEGRPRRVRKVRATRVPWLLFVMAFGIAFGIGQDRQLRRELGSKIKVAASQGAAMVVRRLEAAF